MHKRLSAFAIVLSSLTLPGTAYAETKLTASDASAGAHFGRSVSVSGDVAVIGARQDSSAGLNSGSAYVFRYEGMRGWTEEAKLTADDAATGALFGLSVSVSGDVAVIGAPGADSFLGSAYVFRYDGIGGWTQEAKLTAHAPAQGGRFGYSVSVSGDVAVVGGLFTQSAYLFRYDGISAWTEEAKLTADDAAAVLDRFGHSVSVTEDVAVIGAPGTDTVSGSAYVFRYDGMFWNQEAKLTADDRAERDSFGAAVSVSGDVAVIGAFGDDDAGESSGSAYAFSYDGTNWSQEAKLTGDHAFTGDYFGGAVSVSGDVAVIGAAGIDRPRSPGFAYVFRFNGTIWSQEARLFADDYAASDLFGYAVSVSGDRAVIGAYGDDDAGESSGSAYVYNYLSAEYLLNVLKMAINSLNANGTINNGTANAFKRQLEGVTKQLDKGNLGAACSQLQEFIDDVQAQIDTGKLDVADGQPLIDTANTLRTVLGC